MKYIKKYIELRSIVKKCDFKKIKTKNINAATIASPSKLES